MLRSIVVSVALGLVVGVTSTSSFATKVGDKFLFPATWTNGGCAAYYGQMITTNQVGPGATGAFYPGTVMVVGQTRAGKYSCHVLRYAVKDVATALTDALRNCKKAYQIKPESCSPWIVVD